MPKLKSCPKCGTVGSLIKNGKDISNNQRYKCKSCLKTFILNESTTRDLHISEYILKKVIGFMIDDVTLEVIARNLDVNYKTALFYRYLVFRALENYQDEIMLDGTVLLDETFVRINVKKYKQTRSDGKGIRGISFNHLCVLTLINLNGICIAKVASRGMASPQKYIELCTQNVGKVRLFVHDGATSQKQFMNQFDCTNIDARREGDEDINNHYIDSLHSNIKRYLFKHAGYKLKNLQHYLNFFVYRYNHTPRLKKINTRQRLEIRNQMINDLFDRVKREKKKVTYRKFLKDPGITYILESVKSGLID